MKVYSSAAPIQSSLNATAYNWFWVSWNGGTITAGTGDKTGDWKTTFIYYVDSSFLGINFASVSASNSEAQFDITPYNNTGFISISVPIA